MLKIDSVLLKVTMNANRFLLLSLFLLAEMHQTMRGAAAADAEPIAPKAQDAEIPDFVYSSFLPNAINLYLTTKKNFTEQEESTQPFLLIDAFRKILSTTNPYFIQEIINFYMKIIESFIHEEDKKEYLKNEMEQIHKDCLENYKIFKEKYACNFFTLNSFHQKFILSKLGIFLFEESKKFEPKTASIIDNIAISMLNDGYCGGFATLYIFALLTTERHIKKILTSYIKTGQATETEITTNQDKYIQKALKEIETLDPFNSSSFDNIFWFKAIRKLILSWDTNTPFTQQESIQINRFISLIVLFQIYDKEYFTEQSEKNSSFDLSFTLETTHGIAPEFEFLFESPNKTDDVTKEDLVALLKIIINRGFIVLFKSDMLTSSAEYAFHILGIYQSILEDKIYVFDAASENPNTYECNTIEELVNIISEKCFNDQQTFRNVTIKAFSMPEIPESPSPAPAARALEPKPEHVVTPAYVEPVS